MKKKFLVTCISTAMTLSLIAVSLANATDFSAPVPTSVVSVQPTDGTVVIPNFNVGITPYASYLAIDNEGLTANNGSQTASFDANSTHGWYRIYIKNDGKVKLNISITDNNGTVHGTEIVAAGSSITIVNNTKANGKRTVSVTSGDGSKLNGTISVRLAELKSELE